MSDTSDATFCIFTTLRYDPQLMGCGASETPDDRQCREQNTILNNGRPSPFYLLPYHRDRLLKAAKHFQWEDAITILEGEDGLDRLNEVLGKKYDEAHPMRIKVLVNRSGDISTEHGKTITRPLSNLLPLQLPPPSDAEGSIKGGIPTLSGEHAVVLDPMQTNPSEWTRFKTTQRAAYDAARARAGIVDLMEEKEVLLINSNNEIMEGSRFNAIFWRNGQWITPPLTSGGLGGVLRRWLLEKGLVKEEAIRADEVVDGEMFWLSNALRGLVAGRVVLKEETLQS